MAIRDWPAGERPREKLLEKGSASLSDAELLAIFLRVGVKGNSAVDLARQLLSHFGSLRTPLTASQEDFCAIPGWVRPSTPSSRPPLRWPAGTLGGAWNGASPCRTRWRPGNTYMAKLRDMPHEVFSCLYADNRHRVISLEELFRGTIDGPRCIRGKWCGRRSSTTPRR